MTILGWIVIALLLVNLAVEFVVESLNLNAFKGIPPEFEGIYDPQKYEKSQAYQKESTQFGLFHRAFSTLLLIGFIAMGGFGWIDSFARHFALGPIGTGLIFIGTLSGLRLLLQIPFSVFDTFVIEQKYGFNRTDRRTFIGDLIKGTMLGALLGGLVLAGLIWFFESAGESGWLYAWIAFTAFQLLLMYLAPAVIMPLFNQFTPLPEGPLRQRILDYAQRNQFVLGGIFTMDGSKRSSKSNAFFTGMGRFRRLVLFDTLVEKQSEQELMAVFAHEVGHFKCHHIPKFIAVSVISSFATFYVFSLLLKNPAIHAAFRVQDVSTYASFVFIAILLSPITRYFGIFTHWISRKAEFEADEFSVKTYGDPAAMISALKKLSVDNLSHLTPHPLKVALEYTHPPVLSRIEALRKMEARHGA